jgi:DNA-binding SARP family transcriptional activator/DNA-binding XRE family transcriptional regulator
MESGTIAALGGTVSTSDIDVRALGTALRAHRARNDMTQQDLADLAGVSIRTVRAIERGHSEHPRQASLRQLAGVLHGTTSRPDNDQPHIDILGPLTVRRGDRPVEIGSEHQRCLLGVLALHAGQVVPHNEIIEVLWDGLPPATHRPLLHTAVSRLRKLLGDRVITRRHNGYVLEMDPRHLDLSRFDSLIADAGETPDEALSLLGRALDCWRSPVLADLPERLRQHPTAIAVSGRRLSTVLRYLDIALKNGAHEQAVARAQTLVHDEPFHEGLHARLMLALAGVGQQAAALTVFAEIRDRLRTELAVDPGEELRAAHLRVLRGQISVPGNRNCLPRDLPDFTGRDTELRTLLDAVGTVTAIDGMPGVGKTALAVRLAHELAPHHPDGQLFLDLHAYTAGTDPLSPQDALESLLRQFGVDGRQIPARLDERAALWRAVTAGQRLLVVLDNAVDAAQLRPLLPNGPHTRTLITSRSRLTSLEGVRHLCVDVLPRADAAVLFARVLGRPVTGQEDAVAEVVRLCGFLPLAVRIAAVKAQAHPSWSIAHLVARLGDAPLNELHIGDRSVEAAFALSYRTLGGPQQRMFGLLGESGTPDTDAYAAAALVGIPSDEAEQLLDDLQDAHLLQEPTPGRYEFHDLIRHHAQAAAADHDPADARVRLADYYLHTANQAADLIEPARRAWRPSTPEMNLPRFAGQSDAMAWLTAEHRNLIAIVVAASASGWWNHCWQLTQCLSRYFLVRGHLQDGITTNELALSAAQQAGNTHAEAEAHRNLGFIHTRMGHHTQALQHHHTAIRHYREAGDDSGLARAQIGLGKTYLQKGALPASRTWFSRALNLTRSTEDRWNECLALMGIGICDRLAGATSSALDRLAEATSLAREAGDPWTLRLVLTELGRALSEQGQHDKAIATHEEALSISRALHNKHLEIKVINDLNAVTAACSSSA